MNKVEIGRKEIEEKLPHRERVLLLDRAEIYEDENGLVNAVGYRMVTHEDCVGHFPGFPIMRGVHRVEMIALTLGIAAQAQLEEGFLAFLVGIDEVRFPEVAKLGDEVRSEATITRRTSRLLEGKGVAFVGDKIVAKVGKITCLIARKP
jgi:3-hydroxymyristoyl/3-hydroxydecanoyl-(acyl carrier protein) dehydratase